ncbi:hypothetical protein GP486_007414 [Trichoglossum hirsutum]|uniref:DUF3835 domain-containing protein n=1 Tax=Trichoglossum hirsutum TaxID=265104 RepID=A0A9P8ICS7_9PEZI|nr:hypothetical protein GP486_007414 [Trichoglossum hirsutum]
MALPTKDSFFDLERHRLRLEENILQLKKTLKHWQTWEAEYEGLKEEILAFPGDPQPGDLSVSTSNDDPHHLELTAHRDADVQKNANTVEKRLHNVEEKLNSILVISKPDIRNEEGLPIMEIREELDEEGNVICKSTVGRSREKLTDISASSATASSDTAPQVIEALRKAGVTDLEGARHAETENPERIESAKSESSQGNSQRKQFHVADGAKVDRENSKPQAPDPMGPIGAVSQGPKPSPSRKKSVTFVDDEEKKEQRRLPGHKGQENASEHSAVPRRGAESRKIAELMEDEEEHLSPVVPINESPEDAALRREMQAYAFSEVGAVVAELDLDEEDSQYSYSDDDGEDQETSSVEEEEDRFGRTTRRVVSDKYRREMEALERKLNARAVKNVGPKPSELPLGGVTEDPRQLSAVQIDSAEATSYEQSKKPAKKGVRFAEELDIVPAPQGTSTGEFETRGLQPPLEESVFEQESITGGQTEPNPPTTRRVSKFKSLRASAVKQPSNSPILQDSANCEGSSAKGPLKEAIERSLPRVDPSLPLAPAVAAKSSRQFSTTTALHEEMRATPEGPPGKILSDSVIERSTTDCSTQPPDPDGLDTALLRQEVAMEYHRMRNRMIQREGGFMPREEELERVPITEEEGGSGKKVSRFKAARLGKRVDS